MDLASILVVSPFFWGASAAVIRLILCAVFARGYQFLDFWQVLESCYLLFSFGCLILVLIGVEIGPGYGLIVFYVSLLWAAALISMSFMQDEYSPNFTRISWMQIAIPAALFDIGNLILIFIAFVW